MVPVSSIVIHEGVVGERSDPGTENAGQMGVRKNGHVDLVPRYQRRREQRDVQHRDTFNRIQMSQNVPKSKYRPHRQ